MNAPMTRALSILHSVAISIKDRYGNGAAKNRSFVGFVLTSPCGRQA